MIQEEKEKELNIDILTFGKYVNTHINDVLKDRKYCEWLLKQDWFENGYPYLHKKIISYEPLSYFLKNFEYYKKNKNQSYIDVNDFFNNYHYFNLLPIEKISCILNDNEKICYIYYLQSIQELKKKIKVRQTNLDENIFDIKAPSKWLQKFEENQNQEIKITREDFKNFLNSFELPNITSIVEDIKKQGNLEYKGSKSFLIAKKRSVEQEKYWEDILKEKFNEFINVQFKFENCFFDFINIVTNTIYECKLGLKDFNEEQYNKYLLLTKNKYNIIYLISHDCVINIENETIFTTNIKNYLLYQINIPLLNNPTFFDELIFDFKICEVEDLKFFL
jgi:hypothetical protein